MKKIILSLILFGFFYSLIAQSLEPRRYANAPVSLNFLVTAYNFSTGGLITDPTLNIIDPKINIHAGVFAYVRTFGLYGKAGKFNLVIPTINLNGEAKTDEGEKLTKDVTGLGDIKAIFSLNLYGSPALSKENFKNYTQDLIIGTKLELTIPTGKYEKEKLINIGTNRWAFKAGAGVSKAINKFAVEFLVDAEFYSKNRDFYPDMIRRQDPVYTTQAHIIYNIQKGMWLALNSNYYWGGETQIVGSPSKDDALDNSRYGFVFAMPLSKQQSLKINGSSGISTRTGTDFSSIAIAWQYRWFD